MTASAAMPAVPSSLLARALNADVSQPLTFAALTLAYVVSRAPFINISYGTDPDAWRVALSGYWLWDHHEYYPSRLPGYPVPELASAAVIKGGWLATNSLTLLVSVLGLWFFARLVRELRLPLPALTVVGFAFTPLLWINSMTTMDYMWALTFVLGCYYFLLKQQAVAAGLMLGLAAASRSTSLLFVVPFSIYLIRDGRRRDLRDFVVWAIFVPVIAYLPIAWRYGPKFLSFYDAKVGYLNVIRLLGKDCLGIIGSVAVLAAAALSLPRLARLPSDIGRDKHAMLWALIIAVTLIIFFRLPHESAYLIPLYPFGFFVMARYFRAWAYAAAVAAIVIAGFVDITTPGDDLDASAIRGADIGTGLVLSNRDTMRAQLRYTDAIDRYDIPDNAVAAIGFSYPQFAVRFRDKYRVDILEDDEDSISQLSDKGKLEDKARNRTFVWLLPWRQFEDYRKENRTYWYTVDANRSTVNIYKYRPGLVGGRLIDVPGAPSGGSGTARTDR